MSNVLVPHSDLIADVYVGLTQKFFGGKIVAHNHAPTGGVNADIVNKQRNQLYESKASHQSDRHMMRHEQIEEYETASKEALSLSCPEVYYFFWAHDVRQVQNKECGRLERELVHNTKSLLAVSFDVVKEMRANYRGVNPSNWAPYTPLRASRRNGFWNDPRAELSVLSLDPSEYEIRDHSVSRKRFKRRRISDFTMRIIHPTHWRGLEVQ